MSITKIGQYREDNANTSSYYDIIYSKTLSVKNNGQYFYCNLSENINNNNYYLLKITPIIKTTSASLNSIIITSGVYDATNPEVNPVNGYYRYNDIDYNWVDEINSTYYLSLTPNSAYDKIYIYTTNVTKIQVEIIKPFIWSSFTSNNAFQFIDDKNIIDIIQIGISSQGQLLGFINGEMISTGYNDRFEFYQNLMGEEVIKITTFSLIPISGQSFSVDYVGEYKE